MVSLRVKSEVVEISYCVLGGQCADNQIQQNHHRQHNHRQHAGVHAAVQGALVAPAGASRSHFFILLCPSSVPTAALKRLPGHKEEQPDDRKIVDDGRDAEHTAHNVFEGFEQRQCIQHRIEGRQQPRRARQEQDENRSRADAEHRKARSQPLAATPQAMAATSTMTINTTKASRLPVVNIVWMPFIR